MNHSIYTRLNTYFYYLSCNNSMENVGIRLKDIAENMNLPISVIRNDFSVMLKSSAGKKLNVYKNKKIHSDDNTNENTSNKNNNDRIVYSWPFYERVSDLDLEKEDLSLEFDTEYEELQALGEAIVNGHKDDSIFYSPLLTDQFYLLTLNFDEYKAWQYIRQIDKKVSPDFNETMGQLQEAQQPQAFDILANETMLPENNIKYINFFIDFLKNQKGEPICIRYVHQNKISEETTTFYPVKLSFDSLENTYYLITFRNHKVVSYRLDRIKKINPSPTKEQIARAYLPTEEDYQLLEKAPKVWGMGFNEEMNHVKVRFYDEANVIAKVKRDLTYRSGYKLTEETITEQLSSDKTPKEKKVYIYEDDVYGISSFCNWIYRYGSSAIVLEPESLRQRIINSYQIRQKEYSDS